jgi:hypothetical protein
MFCGGPAHPFGTAAGTANGGMPSEASAFSARAAGDSARNFLKDGYLILRNLVTGSALEFFHEYTVKAAKLGVLPQDDPEMPARHAAMGIR